VLGAWISCAWGMDIVCLGNGYHVFGAWISCAWGMGIVCLGNGYHVLGAWLLCVWGMDDGACTSECMLGVLSGNVRGTPTCAGTRTLQELEARV